MRTPFEERVNKYEERAAQWSKRFNTLGNLKLLALALMLAGAAYMIFAAYSQYLLFAEAALLAVFIALWVYQHKAGKRVDDNKSMADINRQYLSRIDGDWTHFADTGAEFADDHPYAQDLDIVGAKSLFQFLNVSYTEYGRRIFAQDLLQPDYTADIVVERQRAIDELSTNIDFAQSFQYASGQTAKKPHSDISKLIRVLQDKTPFCAFRALRITLIAMPLVLLPLCLLVWVFALRQFYLASAFLLGIQAFVWALGFVKLGRYLKPVGDASYCLNQYARLLELIEEQGFQAPGLAALKNRLTAKRHSAAQAIKALDKIVGRIELRANALLYFALNVLLLWDYQLAFDLQRWKETYASEAESWFHAIGELESLMSFSCLQSVTDTTCMPVISNTAREIRAGSLGHPLLPNSSRVYNDLSMENDIIIITGSNMSGKTTFLRTVGVNAVLALNGAAACAKSFSLSRMRIVTSMRLADDLSRGVSTFYAELQRIKRIIDMAKKHDNVLFLIDELFRGTNSKDRLQGATIVIQTLHTLHAMGMITTHDLELCALADNKRIHNYSFSERYSKDEIIFDYKLMPGMSRTTNAQFLMKTLGIIP